MTQKEISNIQNARCEEIVNYLIANNKDGFEIRHSITNFGVSTYIIGHNLKFRMSDHNVNSFNRINDEIHVSLETPLETVLAIVEKRDAEVAQIIRKNRNEEQEMDDLVKRAEPFLQGLITKKVFRTYQDLKTFSNKGKKIRSNVFQRKENGGAFSYIWTEAADNNENCTILRDKDFLEFVIANH